MLICFVFKIGSYRVAKDGLELAVQAGMVSSLSTHLLLYAVLTNMSHYVQLFDLWELHCNFSQQKPFKIESTWKLRGFMNLVAHISPKFWEHLRNDFKAVFTNFPFLSHLIS